MRRRAFLGLAAGAAAGLAGCTASALPSAGLGGEEAPAGCPALLDVERRVCPESDGPIGVERSNRSVSGDAWSLVVTVTNGSEEPVGLNPYAWSVHRSAEDGWRQVAPNAHIEPWTELAPDAGYAWQLTAGDEGLDGADQRVALGLDPGRYAFAIPLRADRRIGAIARFDVSR
ncbi:MAG: hypothetical protein U5J98_07780 [Halobacteriales archaeon]|nr:hypothetical protein [Halobacteriales archaeon]